MSTANLQESPLWILSIHDRSPSGYLSFDLKDILLCLGPSIQGYSWLITELDCIGEGTDRICQSVEKTKGGLTISADELIDMSQRIRQTIDGTIIGTRKKDDSHPFANGFRDLEHFPQDDAELIIRAIDSSFFEVITKNPEHVQRLEKEFKDTRKEDPQNYFPLNTTGT